MFGLIDTIISVQLDSLEKLINKKIMTPEEAKMKLEHAYMEANRTELPDGFKIALHVPKEIADKARLYYSKQGPFQYDGPFAAGEPFYYKGLRCIADPSTDKL